MSQRITLLAARAGKALRSAGRGIGARLGRVAYWISRNRKEAILIGALLLLSTVTHAWNMFQFPYYENDEATYSSRAWAFATEGELDVYTYRYDHAPLGWMLIGVWQIITGGAAFFGSFLESGRVLMLLVHIASSLLVYALAKRLSGGSKLAGAVAVAFFTLSPLAIYFQRRILLDNIMAFWLLLSVYLATMPVQRLKYYIWSALALGIAVLTKMNAIFIAPAILYIVWIHAHRQHKFHAVAYWMATTGIVVASFFVYALLKGEFFAAPLDAAGNPTHVSVVDTFTLQLGRGDFAWPWEYNSSFVQNILSWVRKDGSILLLGMAASIVVTVVGIVRRKRQPYILALAAMVWLYIAFLARGRLVLDLYIVPLIPLLALAIGITVGIAYKDWLKKRAYRVALVILVILGTAGLFYNTSTRQYRIDETSNQLAAVEWVKRYVPKDAIIAADNYAYPYLAQEAGFKNVSYFFNTEYDPEVRKVYDNDWRNIEYLVLTHEVVKQVKSGTIPRMKQVLDHATLLADYRTDSSSYIDLPNYISTNGDWAQIYKVKTRSEIVQQDSWQHFKDTFIKDYGQVVDPATSLTTSAGQAQAMFRAITMNDKDMFSGIWQWSKDHLRYRSDDTLLSWKWEKQPDGSYALGDSNNVCDADQLIAYALFLADDKWPGKGYGAEAKQHATDWWNKCTFVRDGKQYIDSSADGSQDSKLINTGYFRPAIYRFLAKELPVLPWQQLVSDGYDLLDRIYVQNQSMPNWIIMATDGSLQPASPLLGSTADVFGYDALQLVPNLVEDYAVSSDIRARNMVRKLQVPTAQFATATASRPAFAAYLLLLQSLNSGAQTTSGLQQAYVRAIYQGYHKDKGYWDDGKDFRDQMWMWQWHFIQDTLPDRQQISLK